jgi:hypothetical protein
MKLIRFWGLPENAKRIVNGPCAGGIFFAVKSANDLPVFDKGYSEHDAEYLLRLGTLYFSPAGKQRWEKVTPDNFKTLSMGVDWNYEGQISSTMYELYFVPCSVRAHRHMRRAHRNSYKHTLAGLRGN